MNKFLVSTTLLLLVAPVSYAKVENEIKLLAKKDLKRVVGKKSELDAFQKANAVNMTASMPNESVNLEHYKKVKLIDVVLETLSYSDILKSAREKVIQFEIKVADTASAYYPTLEFQFNYGKNRKTPSGDANKDYKFFNDRNYKFVFSQNLYAGGSKEYSLKAAMKKLEVSKNQYKIVLEEEIKKAVNAYFAVVFANRSVLVNERNMKKLNKILQIVTTKYENGAASIADITSIKASVANATTKLVRVKSKFIEALRYYEYVVGDKFVKTLPFEKNFAVKINSLDDLYVRAMDRNRSLFNYYKSIESELFNIKQSESAFKPKVDFEMSYRKVLDQEDFEERENTINGKVKFTYNFFNGGRDKNKILKVNSDIRDLKYRLSEEKKKIKWNLSKLFTSTQSISQALESTITEIKASRKAVAAYWEAFKLGEQDLPTLLQGQRQLNSAETELVKFEEDHIGNFFNILEITGDLSSFFDVDPNDIKFIDFSKSNYINEVLVNNKPLALVKEEKKEDILKTQKKEEKKEKAEIEIKEDALAKIEPKKSLDEQIKNYQAKFLTFHDEDFSILINDFDNVYKAFDFIKNNNLDENSFVFNELKDYKLKTIIAHNRFDSKEEALKYIDTLNKDLKKSFEVKKIGLIKDLYNKYLDGLEIKSPKAKIKTKVKIVEKFLTPIVKKQFETKEEFKKEFLKSDENKFTINIASFTKLEDVQSLVENNNLYDKTFFFKYGENGQLIKLLNGIYDNYTSAEKDLVLLKSSMKENSFPIIEKISQVKNLYLQNIHFNTKKEEVIEYEYLDKSKNKTIKLHKKEIKKKVEVKENKEELLKQKVQDKKIETLKEEKKIIKEKEFDKTSLENSYKLANAKFLEEYLKAPKNYTSLHIASFNNMEDAQEYIDKNYIENNTILVKSNSGKIMVMYGIYETYAKAQAVISNLPEFISRNKPIIHKIFRTQESFRKNNLQEKIEIKEEINKKKQTEEIKLKKEDTKVEKNQKIQNIEKLEKTEVKKVNKKEKVVKDESKTLKLINKNIELVKETNKKPLEKEDISNKKEIEEIKLKKEDSKVEKTQNIQNIEKLEKTEVKEEVKKVIKKEKIKEIKNIEVKETINKQSLFQKQFTIKLVSIERSKKRWFFKRFSLDKNKAIIKNNNNKIDIYYSQYSSKQEALDKIESLHPKLNPIVVNTGTIK